MKPVKRPFADWVDDRFLPTCQYFYEDHPWFSVILFSAFSLGMRSLFRGWWSTLAMSCGVWVVLIIGLAIGWDVRRRKRQIERLRENHICLHCGYDMRANPERCSECGRRADELAER